MLKCGVRLTICVSAVVLLSLYLLESHIQDICNQYRAGAYLVKWLDYKTSTQPAPVNVAAPTGDKAIVMARLEEEHASWVDEELSDWQRAIYIVNPSSDTRSNDAILKTPSNKGHEAMAYLTYVIDFYDTLPSTIAFLHSHRSGFFKAWHVDAPLHDNVYAMRALNLDFVEQNGYVNLRCNWNPGCKESHRVNAHVTDQVWWDLFSGTSTPPLNSSDPYQIQEKGTQRLLKKPDFIGAACCAQFAVSRAQVHRRPRDDYIKFRQWLLDTDLNDATSGRVMEFIWHVIFGKDGVYCPDEELCYCQVYGQC